MGAEMGIDVYAEIERLLEPAINTKAPYAKVLIDDLYALLSSPARESSEAEHLRKCLKESCEDYRAEFYGSCPADVTTEKLGRLLRGRDDFIVSKGLWDEFVKQLTGIEGQKS